MIWHLLETMISDAKKDLVTAASYIASIPQGLTGYRGFVTMPYLGAVETLHTMQKAGPEEVFSEKVLIEEADKNAVKVSTEAQYNIMRFTYSLMKLEEGKRAGEFMALYKANPDKYCFNPKRFEKWSKNLFEA